MLRNDIRYTLRALGRRPSFVVVMVLTLALGIGANTAIFSVVKEVMLSEPPYSDPETLYRLHMKAVGGAFSAAPGGFMELPWSYPFYRDLAEQSTGFEDMAAYAGFQFNLIGSGDPERIPVEMTSATYFPLLGVDAAHGRVFSQEEDLSPGGHPVILLGWGLWQRRFGGDPGVVNQRIFLDDVALTVIGVLPKGFKGLSGNAQAWVPMMMAPNLTLPKRLEQRFAHWHEIVGRVKPGTSPEQLQIALLTSLANINEASPPPAFYGELQASVISLREESQDPQLNRSLILLFLAVGVVFLVACVNVVSVLLVRTIGRRREMALRLAVGGTRSGIFRLFVVESLVLGVLGGVAGWVVALFGVRLLAIFSPVAPVTNPLEIAPPDAIRLDAVGLGGEVLAVNFLFALVASLVLSVLPILQVRKIDLNRWIKGDGTSLGTGLRGLRRFSPLSLLVVVEIALCVVLLIGAGLLLRSLSQLHETPLGFQPDGLLTLSISRPFGEPESAQRATFYRQLLERVEAAPGVEGASLTNRLPVSLGGEAGRVKIEGRVPEEGAQPPGVGIHKITPGHLETMEIPLIRGRAFTDRDREGAPRVALINQAAAGELFQGENPIGQRIHLSIGWEADDFAEVVGIVGDVRYQTIEEEPTPDVYIPFFQNSTTYPFLVARTSIAPERVARSVRQGVLELDSRIPVFDVKTMEERIGALTSKTRFLTLLLSIFAVVTFLLAAVGLYGVLAYSVTSRTVEIGIRSAVGAKPGSVFSMVIRDAVLLSLVGLALGLALTFASTHLLSSFLYELSSTDPLTIAAACVLLLVAVLLAAAIPASRAVRIDPKVALSCE